MVDKKIDKLWTGIMENINGYDFEIWIATDEKMTYGIAGPNDYFMVPEMNSFINMEMFENWAYAWQDVAKKLLDGKYGPPTYGSYSCSHPTEPKNNQGLCYCWWCSSKTKKILGFSEMYDYCERCGK